VTVTGKNAEMRRTLNKCRRRAGGDPSGFESEQRWITASRGDDEANKGDK
jgi:hypothetical protein